MGSHPSKAVVCAGFAVDSAFPVKSVKMSYGLRSVGLFIARIETIVTAIQKNDLIVSAPMVRLSNAPPPITWTPNATKTRIVDTAMNSEV